MDGLLRSRAAKLSGILNGVDYDEWNPETDPHLPANYSPLDLIGKGACKLELLEEMGLPVDLDRPLIGIVSRFADQKGMDLVAEAAPFGDAALVALGSGDLALETSFRELALMHPDRCAVRIGYNDGLAHRIEAGADMFLMPSRYEPCGLNQIYSLRYGTVPIVRATGGLADTVESDTGFTFRAATPAALAATPSKKPSRHFKIAKHGPNECAWAWRRIFHGMLPRKLTGSCTPSAPVDPMPLVIVEQVWHWLIPVTAQDRSPFRSTSGSWGSRVHSGMGRGGRQDCGAALGAVFLHGRSSGVVPEGAPPPHTLEEMKEGFAAASASAMRAVDTNVLVRLIVRDDAGRAALADAFIAKGAWVSHLAVAETAWVLTAVYERKPAEVVAAVEIL